MLQRIQHMLQRIQVPVKGREQDSYLDDSILDILIHLSAQGVGCCRLALVGKSNFFYRKLVPINGSWEHKSVVGWTQQQDLFTCYDYLLVPVCQRFHWCLAVVDLQASEIVIVDSFCEKGQWHWDVICNIRRWLQAELQNRGITKWSGCDWKERWAQVAKQTNGYDCGVHVIGYIECLKQVGMAAADFQPSQCVPLRYNILKTLTEPYDELICS